MSIARYAAINTAVMPVLSCESRFSDGISRAATVSGNL
jgi:hypothetical protein